LFAAGGQDPTGPMTAKITFISQFGLPRIAQDFVAPNASAFGPGGREGSDTLASASSTGSSKQKTVSPKRGRDSKVSIASGR
jgi:hypothetical protein